MHHLAIRQCLSKLPSHGVLCVPLKEPVLLSSPPPSSFFPPSFPFHPLLLKYTAEDEFQTLCFDFGIELDEVVSRHGAFRSSPSFCLIHAWACLLICYHPDSYPSQHRPTHRRCARLALRKTCVCWISLVTPAARQVFLFFFFFLSLLPELRLHCPKRTRREDSDWMRSLPCQYNLHLGLDHPPYNPSAEALTIDPLPTLLFSRQAKRKW